MKQLRAVSNRLFICDATLNFNGNAIITCIVLIGKGCGAFLPGLYVCQGCGGVGPNADTSLFEECWRPILVLLTQPTLSSYGAIKFLIPIAFIFTIKYHFTKACIARGMLHC